VQELRIEAVRPCLLRITTGGHGFTERLFDAGQRRYVEGFTLIGHDGCLEGFDGALSERICAAEPVGTFGFEEWES